MTTSPRHLWRWRLFLSVLLGGGPVVGCGEASATGSDAGVRRQPLPTSEQLVIQIGNTRDQAQGVVGARCEPRIRGTRNGVLIEAMGGGLAEAPDETQRLGTALTFLAECGALLMDPKAGVPTEPIRLKLVARDIKFETAHAVGAFWVFAQTIDGFTVQDTMTTARFEGKRLIGIAGRLFDPALSPTRAALPMECVDEAKARDRFLALASNAEAPSGLIPGRYVDFKSGSVTWRYRGKVLDAVSCKWLGDEPPPFRDPIDALRGGKE